LGFATDLDRIAFTGAPGEESFAIRSDVGTHTNEEGRSSASIEFLNRQTNGPPEGGLCVGIGFISGRDRSALPAAISHEAEASEAQDHHSPSRDLGDGSYKAA